MKKLIIDTDPGIDDFTAIVLASQLPDIELLGVTTVFGNAQIEQVTKNALNILELLGLSNVPVAAGARKPKKLPWSAEGASYVHGTDGLGNIFLNDPKSKAIGINAEDFIFEQANKFPGEINLVALGPLTNLANAFEKFPTLPSLLKSVTIMGGAILINGNATAAAEFNILTDPHAADTVLSSGAPITLVGLDVTHEIVLRKEFFDRLAQSKKPYAKTLANSYVKYREFYHEHVIKNGVFNHDPTAILYLHDPSIFETIEGPTRVITDGISIGHTLMDRRNFSEREDGWSKIKPIKAAVKVNSTSILQLMSHYLT